MRVLYLGKKSLQRDLKSRQKGGADKARLKLPRDLIRQYEA
jgi:hypothetical protein